MQHVGPDGRDLHLQGCFGRPVNGRDSDRFRQRPDVDLAVEGHWQTLQQHQVMRHQMLGQGPLQRCPNAVDHGLTGFVLCSPVLRDQVGGQLPIGVFANDSHNGAFDARQLPQAGIDLGQLDAIAADFHLAIDTSGENPFAVSVQAYPVAGTVHPRTLAATGVGHEALGRERRLAQVTTSKPCTGDIELPPGLAGHGVKATVQRMGAQVLQGLAEQRPLLQGMSKHTDRGFGGAVVVDHLEAGRQCLDPAQKCWATGFTPNHQTTPRQSLGTRSEHGLQVRGDDLQCIDGMRLQVGGEDLGIEHRLLGQHVQGLAVAQRTEQHGVAKVGRRRGDHRQATDLVHWQALTHAAHIVDQGAMADCDALGLASGAGGVDDIGKVVCTHRHLGRRNRGVVTFHVDCRNALRQADLPGSAKYPADRAIGKHEVDARLGLLRVQRR